MEVEAVKLVTGLLRIHHILVYDIGGSFGLIGDALTDLTVLSISNDVSEQRAWRE